MKNIARVMMVVLVGMATTATAAELKIGVVNAQKVLEQAPQADAARKRLDGEFAPRDKAVTEMQKELRRDEERLEKDGAIMSETERSKLEREIVAQRRDFKRKQDEFREDLNGRRNEEFGKLQKLIADVILNVAKTGGYDLVLTDGVLYASDKVDITDAVLQRLATTEKEPASGKAGSSPKGSGN